MLVADTEEKPAPGHMIIYKNVEMFKLLLGESKQTFCSYLAQEINNVFSNDLYNMDILSNVHYFTQLIGKLINWLESM